MGQILLVIVVVVVIFVMLIGTKVGDKIGEIFFLLVSAGLVVLIIYVIASSW